jgi:hypothetical protein
MATSDTSARLEPMFISVAFASNVASSSGRFLSQRREATGQAPVASPDAVLKKAVEKKKWSWSKVGASGLAERRDPGGRPPSSIGDYAQGRERLSVDKRAGRRVQAARSAVASPPRWLATSRLQSGNLSFRGSAAGPRGFRSGGFQARARTLAIGFFFFSYSLHKNWRLDTVRMAE